MRLICARMKKRSTACRKRSRRYGGLRAWRRRQRRRDCWCDLRQLHLPYSLKAQPLLAPSDYQTILYMFPLLSTATPVSPAVRVRQIIGEISITHIDRGRKSSPPHRQTRARTPIKASPTTADSGKSHRSCATFCRVRILPFGLPAQCEPEERRSAHRSEA
jgi:hypothetical protein